MKATPFVWMCENDNGEWVDTLFFDMCKNGSRREWRLCLNTRSGEKYAQLLRSESDDGDFSFSVILPRKFVSILSEVM